MTAGVSPLGLTIKTLEEIKQEIEADQLVNIDPGLDLSTDQPLGQMNGIVAKKAAELWELGQTCYNAFNPAACEGFLLDALCLLSGTIREQATQGTVILDCDIDGGTTLLAGALANVVGQPSNKWELITTYFAAVSGIHSLPFRAVDTGPITANAASITVITTAVPGWNTVTNLLSATPGRARETDAELRLRRQQELSAPGASTVDSIRADVARVDGVIQCTVFENTGDVIDLDGIPAHSFEVVIWDGTAPAAVNAEVGQAVWDAKPAGIYSHGAILVLVPDTEGILRAARFTRATQRSLEQAISIQVLPGWNAAQVASIQARLQAKASTFRMGQDVILEQLRAVVMAEPYVHDITAYTLGNTGGPLFAANKVIATREIPLFNGPINITVSQLTQVP